MNNTYSMRYHIRFLLTLFLAFRTHSCENRINRLFEEINEVTVKFNNIGAEIAWQYSLDPKKYELPSKAANYQFERIIWQQGACERVESLQEKGLLNTTQQRQAYILCRGPKYTYHEAREMSNLYEELQTTYSNAELCVPQTANETDTSSVEDAIERYLLNLKRINKADGRVFDMKVENLFKSEGFRCIKGEDEFNNLMKTSKNFDVLKFVWATWRENMRSMRTPLRKLVDLQNKAARRNGYTDIGASWRDELEISNLRLFCRRLYQSIKPLYDLLHGVVRFFLRAQYGDEVPARGPIPAHLLGNLWSHNWEPLAEFIIPKRINLDDRIKTLKWTVVDMIKKAEDFYVSLGLPAMTGTFWRKSVMSRETEDERCHGTAADMYREGDVRILYCSGTTFEDFSVVHHEMGHIQYYMAYQHQPGLFRQANSAFHESIGDAVMYGVRTPQHLHRLKLINDTELFNVNNKISNLNQEITVDDASSGHVYFDENSDINENNFSMDGDLLEDVTTDDILILKQALNKLPQIPFSLLIDEYRWKYFEGSLDEYSLNGQFWDMTRELQGILPSEERGEEYFDVGAIFHVADNTPYIRYFLSSVLQPVVWERMCGAAVRGRRPRSPPASFDLLRCDVYGSKVAGKLLKDLMSRGTSQHWSQILKETIGESEISTSSLKRYYRPLRKLLTRLVQKYNIPIGW